ncbi:MAG: carboxypeptidase regulatory-like domain-containing protein [Flavobacteriales bacterium]|nr:carboxypeptidase regulatory-like domain-containing protein [Flavobacteriales bacterium]
MALSLTLGMWAQGGGDPEAHTRIADRHYQQMAYAPAAREYKLAADLGAVNEHVSKRLADCYMRLGDTENAEIWYAQVVKFLNRQPSELYNYAQALKGNAKYAEAEEWMDRYLVMVKPEGQPLHSNISDFAKKFTFGMDRFSVKGVGLNTPGCDMAATWNGDQSVIFSSSRAQRTGIKRLAAWNEQPFLDLYSADRQPGGELMNPRSLSGDVNGPLHEGPAVCDASGTNLWFTRNSSARGKNGVIHLNIMRARRNGGGWKGAEPFELNDPETSVGHPAISRDGKTFVFASDMPGGLGGTDLYMCKDQGGHWSEPVNMGPVVNTDQDESFPFIGADGALYFASNGQPGLGGLDVFVAQRDAEGKYSVAINVGAPVNSPKDDFAFIIDGANKTGYFTSNRPGGQGDDDIYSFVMHTPLEQRFLCTGTVIDEETGSPLIEVDVTLEDKDGNVIESKQTDVNGKYSFAVQKNKEYRVVAKMKGRYDGDEHLSTENIEQQQILARDIHMVPDAGIWLRGAVHHKGKLGYIEGMNVSVVNLSSFYTETRTTGSGGGFSFRLQPNEQYEVLFEKEGLFSMSVPTRTIGVKQGVIDLNEAVDLAFEPVLIGQPLLFKYQRWEHNSANLDPVAKTELDALADRMIVNPALQIEVAVHSDARGDLASELKLSQKRADAIGAYLRSKGVVKERLVAKGYGATRLLNHCAPGVSCTEAEHSENRRTEYVVTGVATQ